MPSKIQFRLRTIAGCLAVMILLVGGCGNSKQLTREKAAELIRNCPKFNQQNRQDVGKRRVLIEITGISQLLSSEAQVNFTYTWKTTNGTSLSNNEQIRAGMIPFELYDDGWRVNTNDFYWSDIY
jgi:hypothetical protein